MSERQGIELDGVFNNIEALKSSYTPSELTYRESQLDKTASVLVSALRGDTPSNILMHGRKGTGKTTTARYVGRELESAGQGIGEPCEFKYLDCGEFDTQNKVITRLARKFGRSDVPETGWPKDHVYEVLLNAIDSHQHVVVLALDEIDKLVKNDGDRVLYSLSRINTDLDNSTVSLIGISDDVQLTRMFDPRIKSSLGEVKVFFQPYSKDELREVLDRRADTAFEDGAVTQDAVALCAEFAVEEREYGDAGYALDLLRAAGEKSESLGARTVLKEDVRRARDELRTW